VIALLLALVVVAPPAPLPRVLFRTAQGDLVIEVDEARAPATARNAGGSFHRTVTTSPDNQPGKAVKIDVVQAGAAPGKDLPPVALERTRDTGLLHLDGAVSMARDGPDTATSDFFVCVGAQPSLDFGGKRNPDGQGFAVLGRVVSGMEVVRRIHAAPAKGQSLSPSVKILGASRVAP
jgi:peptidyl-prolyl cis-trans isomerase A (cyclophilin A)